MFLCLDLVNEERTNNINMPTDLVNEERTNNINMPTDTLRHIIIIIKS